jgi:hypothetical protein
MQLVLALCTGGTTAGLAGHGCALTWCTDYLLGPWRAASWPGNASGVADRAPLASTSPLRTPTAGVRSCRKGRLVVPVGHAPLVLHRLVSGPLPAIRRIYMGSASTVSPPRTGWQHVSCLQAASTARGSDTSRGTVSSDGRCLLPFPAQWELCRVRLQLCLVQLRAAAVGADGGDVTNVGADQMGTTLWRQQASPPTTSGGQLEPPKRHRTTPHVRLPITPASQLLLLPHFASSSPTRLRLRCA